MIKLNSHEIKFKTFPNGESFADIEKTVVEPTKHSNTIFFRFETDKDIFNLMCVKDFVDENWFNMPCHLIMPYIPYSRMDRQEENRLFTLKTFARLINSMNFASVIVWEPHSEVAPALIDRIHIINKTAQLALFAMGNEIGFIWGGLRETLPALNSTNDIFPKGEEKGIYFIYPDAGAEKRYTKQLKYPKVLTCSKNRDFDTGNIQSITLNGAANAQDCRVAIIVDDISSRGGTFVGCASELHKHLPNLERVILCVAHCENAIYDGDVLAGKDIDKVYTTDSILDIREGYEEKLEVIKV